MLRGLPGMFCSGADLKFIRDGGGERRARVSRGPAGPGRAGGYGERFKQILEYIHSTISEIRRAPKPFIAAVDGVAAAGGFGIAMSCDLVLASSARASSGRIRRPALDRRRELDLPAAAARSGCAGRWS